MSAFRETYRGSVAAWECDQYGHLNVQFYVGRLSDAVASMLLAGGLGRKGLEQRRLGMVAVNQTLDYLKELRAGTLLRVESAVKLIEGRKMVLHHRLFDAETGEIAFTADVLGLCFDLEARKSVPWPEDLRQGFSGLLIKGDEPLVQQALPASEPGWIASHRSPVNAWECDRMGHLNVQFYLGRAAEADRQVLNALGLGPKALKALGLRVRAQRYRLAFKRELHAAAITTARSGIRVASADELQFYHEIHDAETGILAASVEATITLEQRDSGAGAAIPAAALAKAAAFVATFAGPPLAPPNGASVAPTTLQPGMYETARGGVDQWECDEDGRMAERFLMARFSSAAMNLLSGSEYNAASMRDAGLGSAALDYTIDIKRPMRVGDAFNCRTGVLELRDKTWRFCHVLLDSNSGETIATADVMAVLFDLKARKSVPLPPEARAGFAKRMLKPVAG
ncbi:acyl-CoA thioesterase [Ferrovibrio sp.]|uniref:acyl-CoA thioesterase n=1 Tax=Ferrovibrio sp. TaxID=1917215 RepID=UPI003D0E5CC7